MKKILHVIHGLNLGGAENFIYNLLSAIDENEFRFDFAIQEPEIKHKKFKELIEATGGKIFVIPDFMHNPVGQVKALRHLLKNSYDYVHIHMNAFINPLPAIVAGGANCRVIIHSHSTRNGRGGAMGKLLHKLNKMCFLRDKFIRLACSSEAGRWMFGSHDFQMIPNAIDTAIYRFNEAYRHNIREKYGLTNEYVIGQVGRLISLKNQRFSIGLLAKIRKEHPELDAKLMLVGDGPQKEGLVSFARQLHVEEAVIFTGAVHNINEYYSAFDSFIMPSLFEGLALVAVEAQASGIHCVISDTVTREADITGSIKFLPLSLEDTWLECLFNFSIPYDRSIIADKVCGSEFDHSVMVKKMQRVYC